MFGLQYFSFQAIWSPMFLFATIAVVIAYLYIIGPWREKHYPMEKKVSGGQIALFISAALLYYITNGGPSSLLGHIMFSFHMVNMSISYLIVPPMVLASVPSFVWKKVFSAPMWQKFKFLMHPIVTLILFNMTFSVYHIPVIHDYVMTHYTVHNIYYVVMLIMAFMMWWHVITPVKEWAKLAHVKKMAYIFANGVLLTPACALIIFTNASLYAIYNDPEVWVQAMGYCVPGDTSFLLEQFEGPQFFNMFTVIEDQQTGGIIMKLVQEVTYGVLLGFVFRDWFNKEHKQEDLDAKLLKDAMLVNQNK
ncbi:MAG: cytochrome c oxidase assembly factor CtaG [Candidatus Pristimantibacillus lignocellulolyticus]|uniref:Cytochrome c oxidase assembly factor CtaG n=1 Tax=Candidatus Pristimantibacillus lignocellulolyticus TaxID=2994561 RepID=A0A9J6Z9R7_9BACL|nr:MAG: cytochrome c oxidase assembly factor CtaG [Candidatus Pristimantibacillus lignocellulolyticus]